MNDLLDQFVNKCAFEHPALLEYFNQRKPLILLLRKLFIEENHVFKNPTFG